MEAESSRKSRSNDKKWIIIIIILIMLIAVVYYVWKGLKSSTEIIEDGRDEGELDLDDFDYVIEDITGNNVDLADYDEDYEEEPLPLKKVNFLPIESTSVIALFSLPKPEIPKSVGKTSIANLVPEDYYGYSTISVPLTITITAFDNLNRYTSSFYGNYIPTRYISALTKATTSDIEEPFHFVSAEFFASLTEIDRNNCSEFVFRNLDKLINNRVKLADKLAKLFLDNYALNARSIYVKAKNEIEKNEKPNEAATFINLHKMIERDNFIHAMFIDPGLIFYFMNETGLDETNNLIPGLKQTWRSESVLVGKYTQKQTATNAYNEAKNKSLAYFSRYFYNLPQGAANTCSGNEDCNKFLLLMKENTKSFLQRLRMELALYFMNKVNKLE